MAFLSLSHFLHISLTSHHFKLYFIHLFYMHNLCILKIWFFMIYNNDIDTCIELNSYKFNQEVQFSSVMFKQVSKITLVE